jgi:hypothetical protein
MLSNDNVMLLTTISAGAYDFLICKYTILFYNYSQSLKKIYIKYGEYTCVKHLTFQPYIIRMYQFVKCIKYYQIWNDWILSQR